MILDILGIGSKIIDKIFPDAGAAEQAKLKLLELQQSGQLAQLNADIQEQQELTKRHTSDMSSDSWLSKNIRPMTLLIILAGYFTFAFMSAFDLETHKQYVELLGQWGIIIMSFYFGGRTVEKVADMVERRKAKEYENVSK
jgi:Holin of 3TMs, for gene-transfer release